jgi:hypothetical protein
METRIIDMQEDNWIDSSFIEELLEFTKANTIQRERKIQQARSRGAGQKEVDKERKSITRDQERQSETTNPWKGVVIVRTNQDGKTRLIPKSDYDQGRHELLYGQAPGQPPKPEVTPNVAQEIAAQDDFEASKTSNRLLGVPPRKKQPKQEVIRSDQYDYPKDGVERIDKNSTYPDWDHSPDSVAQGIALVANSAAGKEVNVDMIQGMFGKSQTLMDSSIRAFQQIGDFIKGQFVVDTPEDVYDTSMEWSQGAPSLQPPFTDLIVQTQDGKTFNVAIVEDKTKVVMTPESEDLFRYSLTKVGPELETTEKETTKKLEKLKEKVVKRLTEKSAIGVSRKYKVNSSEDFKTELIADFESILESSKLIEKMIVVEGLSGTDKFGFGSPAAANTLMSMARDGTDVKMCPLDETHIKRLIGETTIKIKLIPEMGEAPIDQVLALLDDEKNTPQISEFFDLGEGVTEAKMMLDQVMGSSESILLAFFSLLQLKPDSIVIENINLDAVGSISGGNFTKVTVNKRNFYVEIEKDTNYYDGSTVRIPDPPPPMMDPGMQPPTAPPQIGAGAPVQEERDWKHEYNSYHKKTVQKKRRAARNNIRRKYIKKHGNEALKGKDIDHKDHNPLNNSSNNVRLRDVSSNRGDNKVSVKEEHGAGEEGTIELLLKYLHDTPYMSIPRELLNKGKKNAKNNRTKS